MSLVHLYRGNDILGPIHPGRREAIRFTNVFLDRESIRNPLVRSEHPMTANARETTEAAGVCVRVRRRRDKCPRPAACAVISMQKVLAVVARGG
ncbi:hypothetical protein EVAR_26706_1 [Eumeta japonica]|uniref:Uncharacterized protein n=1 Tax=Eumeta variegata TaxID=151549 RepID=A0A4C1ZQJ0_EUMVA|nr:hypothetical protein EVAR_26706_1 [Eumeta japonica]